MEKGHFSSFLRLALQNGGLSQRKLHAWIEANQASANPKKRHAIKEQLRKAACAEPPLEAWQYPFIHEIARFFEAQGHRDTASRIRHIFLQQSFDLGVIPDIFAPAKSNLQPLWWLIFPPPSLHLCAKDVRRWRQMCGDGDYRLYRHTMHLYQQLALSAVHAPIRKHISADLARIALYNGEYAEAYKIARHIERSLRESQSQSSSRGDTISYLRALRLRASAAGNMFPMNAFEASKSSYEWAEQELNRCHQEQLVTDRVFYWQKTILDYRRLRMLTNLVICGNTASLKELYEGIATLDNSIKRLDKELLTPDPHDEPYPSAAHDTLARAYALAAIHEIEGPAKDQKRASELLAKAEQHQLHAERLLSGQKREGRVPVLGQLRSKSTEIIRICADRICNKKRGNAGLEDIEDLVTGIMKLVGPTIFRHSQTNLGFLTRFVDRVYAGAASLNSEVHDRMRRFLDENAFKSQLADLDREVKNSLEVPFPPDYKPIKPKDAAEDDELTVERRKWSEQPLALIQANRMFVANKRRARESE